MLWCGTDIQRIEAANTAEFTDKLEHGMMVYALAKRDHLPWPFHAAQFGVTQLYANK